MKETLEIILLIVAILGLAACLVNSILLTIDSWKTVKYYKNLHKEYEKTLESMREDCKKLSENTTK